MVGYFDGSCEPINPGGTARFGWAIKDGDLVVHVGNGTIGSGKGITCNVAEYAALVDLLKFISENQIDIDSIYGDSKLVINMVTGIWGRKNPHKKAPHLKDYLFEAKALLGDINLMWIPREENELADYYSKLI